MLVSMLGRVHLARLGVWLAESCRLIFRRNRPGEQSTVTRNPISSLAAGAGFCLSDNIRNCVNAGEAAFLSRRHAGLTAAMVSDAVNQLVAKRDWPQHVRTTEEEVIVVSELTADRCSEAFYAADATGRKVLSPAGAVLIGLTMIRQKISNPLCRADSVGWVELMRTRIRGKTKPAQFELRVREVPPQEVLERRQVSDSFRDPEFDRQLIDAFRL